MGCLGIDFNIDATYRGWVACQRLPKMAWWVIPQTCGETDSKIHKLFVFSAKNISPEITQSEPGSILIWLKPESIRCLVSAISLLDRYGDGLIKD